MDKKEREALRHQEDQAMNRGLCWVGGAVVLEFLLMLLKKHYINVFMDDAGVSIFLALDKVLRVLAVAGPVVMVLGFAWMFFNMKKGKSVVLPGVIAAAAVVLGLCAHVARVFKAPGIQMQFLLVPLLAGLALSYFIYQHEFFLTAMVSILGILGLWFVRYRGSYSLESNLVLLAIALVILFTILVKKNRGLLPMGKKNRFISEEGNYLPIFASALVSVLALVLALFMGTTVAYYLTYAMVIWLFAMLVYYTVKLM